MVSSPVMIHAVRSPPALPTPRAISAATIKMPVPIIEPATSIVESNRPSVRRRPPVSSSLGTSLVDTSTYEARRRLPGRFDPFRIALMPARREPCRPRSSNLL